jgi:hypothetical protein
MKKFVILKTMMLLFVLFSCGGSSNPAFEQEDALRNEVFAIHDEVMPKMSDIVRLKGNLVEFKTDAANEAEVKGALIQLEKAEDAMMSWMNNFKAPEKMRDLKSHDEIMGYLQSQKEEIAKVRDSMNGSISTAERILSSSKN